MLAVPAPLTRARGSKQVVKIDNRPLRIRREGDPEPPLDDDDDDEL